MPREKKVKSEDIYVHVQLQTNAMPNIVSLRSALKENMSLRNSLIYLSEEIACLVQGTI